jgi:hypothetical protein
MTGSAAHVAGPWRYERLDDVGRWVQLQHPRRSTRCCSTSWVSIATIA